MCQKYAKTLQNMLMENLFYQPDGEWFLPLGSGCRPTASIDPAFNKI